MSKSLSLNTVEHRAEFCVVGGGMAGLCAAVAAARHGAKTVLIHDRPVLGGNASSECRMHICGAPRHEQFKHLRETGLLEEVRLENLRRNPNRNYSIWDTVLYELARFQENLTLLLNCACMDASMSDSRIETVTGFQSTTQQFHRVRADLFADCSGDAVLAPLTGAEFRRGREARSEFGESIAPEHADDRTMGLTCLFQARRYETPQEFTPPTWANTYESCDELPFGSDAHRYFQMGYWWIELGGEDDEIADTEALRDRLLKIVYGVWDHIKNHCEHSEAAKNWALDWVQFLPAKRESRRYVGDHLMTQHDVEAKGRFDDVVAYGGWTMDDHNPAGINCVKIGAPATIWHDAPSPYGISYRTLYSRNVENLFCAGRCHSATHVALSSTRVMATCAVMGQAVGTAAAIAARDRLLPRGVGDRMRELQQTLLRDDCYLPEVPQEFSELTRTATLKTSTGDGEVLRNGWNRTIGEDANRWGCKPGDFAAYEFDAAKDVREVTLICDSAMDKNIKLSNLQEDHQLTAPPDVLPKAFRIEVLRNGTWKTVVKVEDNVQRLVRVGVREIAEGARFVLEETRGAERSGLYAFYVD